MYITKAMSSMIDIRLSNVDELTNNCVDLFKRQYDELSTLKGLSDINPHIEGYRELEDSDQLLILAAWDDDKIVGYSAGFLGVHHHSLLKVYTNDLIFLDKEYRKGFTGVKLINKTRLFAELKGAKIVTWIAKTGSALKALLPRLGYNENETVYSSEV